MPISDHSAPSLREERALWRSGCRRVAGVDEAGRGAWAGPVVAAAVILPCNPRAASYLRGVNDSKQLTPTQRAALRERIERVAVAWAVGSASNAEIDALGIVPATRLAMMRAVAALQLTPDALLIDALDLPELPIVQRAFPRADAISLSVAAASILAKTTRDAVMCALDATASGYGFADHKGYGTRAHAEALARLGPCWAHRRTFKPVAALSAAPSASPACQSAGSHAWPPSNL
ncbi:MAG: ribonuclease HII [Anaerolineae bacterium]|nr:ribonuclease HII [Anaerolineae bacterium]